MKLNQGTMKRGAILGAVAIGAICGYQLNASAGQKTTYNLKFETDGTKPVANISGAIGSVRNSSDSTQYHTCYVQTSLTWTYGICASRSGSATRTCFTEDPALLTAIRSINGDSWVHYQYRTAEPNAGDCMAITVENGSIMAPK